MKISKYLPWADLDKVYIQPNSTLDGGDNSVHTHFPKAIKEKERGREGEMQMQTLDCWSYFMLQKWKKISTDEHFTY